MRISISTALSLLLFCPTAPLLAAPAMAEEGQSSVELPTPELSQQTAMDTDLSEALPTTAPALPLSFQTPEWMRSKPIQSLRICDEGEEEEQCPPGCFCLIIRNTVNCFC